MFYIIGSKEERSAWEAEHSIPYFECEEQLDEETACLHDHDDDAATLFVNLNAEPRYAVQASDGEGIGFEEEYERYEDALEAYSGALER